MKVDSPVGRFPFEPERVSLRNRNVVLEGRMGAWPTAVELEAADALRLARVLARPLALATAAVAAAALVRRARRERPRSAAHARGFAARSVRTGD